MRLSSVHAALSLTASLTKRLAADPSKSTSWHKARAVILASWSRILRSANIQLTSQALLRFRSLLPSTSPSRCAKYTPAGAVGAREACKPPLVDERADFAANKSADEAWTLRSSASACKAKCSPCRTRGSPLTTVGLCPGKTCKTKST